GHSEVLAVVGGRASLDPGNWAPSLPRLGQTNRREVRDAVRCDVFRWIAHLVHELLGHPGDVDPPAGTGVLGDLERAVRGRLDDRIPYVGQVGSRLPILQAVPAAALGSALDRMPSHGSRGQ